MSGKQKRLRNKFNNLLEIPKDVSGILPRVTIIGFEEMLIENYKGIIEYEEFYIKLKTRNWYYKYKWI